MNFSNLFHERKSEASVHSVAQVVSYIRREVCVPRCVSRISRFAAGGPGAARLGGTADHGRDSVRGPARPRHAAVSVVALAFDP